MIALYAGIRITDFSNSWIDDLLRADVCCEESPVIFEASPG